MARRLILWSGGFDSTGLVLEALHRGDSVVPIVAPVGEWQKTVRERHARDMVRWRLPIGMRRRLETDQEYDQGQMWSAYDAIRDRLRQRVRETGQPDPEMFSPQIPMLVATAKAAGPPWTVEAAYVAGDWALTCQAQRTTLNESIRLPFASIGKRDILRRAEALGFAGALAWTWSCEGANDKAIAGPCGACDPCKARIIPGRTWVKVDPVDSDKLIPVHG